MTSTSPIDMEAEQLLEVLVHTIMYREFPKSYALRCAMVLGEECNVGGVFLRGLERLVRQAIVEDGLLPVARLQVRETE